MINGQMTGQQRDLPSRKRLRGTIAQIAENGMPDRRQLNADLVSTSGFQGYLQEARPFVVGQAGVVQSRFLA